MPKRPIYLFSLSSHPDAIHINSLDITFFKPEIDFSKYDYLIITSKQASKALQQYDKKEYVDKPALCVSKQSAKSYEVLGGQILAVGKGYGDNLGEYINSFAKETRWLYLRAKTVASDFTVTSRQKGYLIDEAVVYESSCSSEIYSVSPKENAIVIFTSPSSLQCFLQTHILSADMSVIVIGKTTAKALPKGVKYYISDKTTIQSCMELAYSLRNKEGK